jgi:site-specific DNA-methyltransferase (adenine-specific)
MMNLESLIAMAERAGLSAQISSNSPSVTFTTQMSLPFDGNAIQLSIRANLEAQASRPQPLECVRQAGETPALPGTSGAMRESYSVCVASLPASANDRFQPFNAKQADRRAQERVTAQLCDAAARLDGDGLMFVYGLPRDLARVATALGNVLAFRYWIAIRTMTASKENGLRPDHTGLLVMSKPGAAINPLRIPHPRCRHCDQPLKDWGGKSHLMHPEGVRLSDVWMDIVVDPYERMPAEVFERILELAASPERASLALLFPEATQAITNATDSPEHIRSFNPLAHKLRGRPAGKPQAIPETLLNRLHRAPCLDVLRRIPSASVDLTFADPPFNLAKSYEGYKDDLTERDYLGWCKRWLVEYERVLKPGGALFILNLPKWAIGLTDFLLRSGSLYLQNWIVWNALPEPKGVLMPAHYALLYFTKGKRPARFNYCSMEKGWQPFDEVVFPPDRSDVCERRACVRRRRASTQTWRGELTDIWYDIHRERRPIKKTAGEKAHPCATPERLLDRIIRLASNPGDIVLDAFAGTGTSALVAERLNRQFIAIEQADEYLHIADRRLREKRSSWQRATRPSERGAASKRALQIELKRLTLMLGRLPNIADVAGLSKYTPAMFEQAFDSWSVALKAARNVLAALPEFTDTLSSTEQLEMFAQSFGVPPSSEIVRKPDLPPEAGTSNLISSLTHNVAVITNEEDPSSYPIS